MSRKLKLKFQKGEKKKKGLQLRKTSEVKVSSTHKKKYSMNATCREKEAKKVEHMIEKGELKQFRLSHEVIISNGNPFKIESKTLLLNQEYSMIINTGSMNSILWLLMPWLLVSPGSRQIWYWLNAGQADIRKPPVLDLWPIKTAEDQWKSHCGGPNVWEPGKT